MNESDGVGKKHMHTHSEIEKKKNETSRVQYVSEQTSVSNRR